MMQKQNEIVLRGSNRVNLTWTITFLQRMINRLIFGNRRYGSPKSDKFYFDRAARALKQYAATHNQEYLVDAANYCLLESNYPQFEDSHYQQKDSYGRNHKI